MLPHTHDRSAAGQPPHSLLIYVMAFLCLPYRSRHTHVCSSTTGSLLRSLFLLPPCDKWWPHNDAKQPCTLLLKVAMYLADETPTKNFETKKRFKKVVKSIKNVFNKIGRKSIRKIISGLFLESRLLPFWNNLLCQYRAAKTIIKILMGITAYCLVQIWLRWKATDFKVPHRNVKLTFQSH